MSSTRFPDFAQGSAGQTPGQRRRQVARAEATVATMTIMMVVLPIVAAVVVFAVGLAEGIIGVANTPTAGWTLVVNDWLTVGIVIVVWVIGECLLVWLLAQAKQRVIDSVRQAVGLSGNSAGDEVAFATNAGTRYLHVDQITEVILGESSGGHGGTAATREVTIKLALAQGVERHVLTQRQFDELISVLNERRPSIPVVGSWVD